MGRGCSKWGVVEDSVVHVDPDPPLQFPELDGFGVEMNAIIDLASTLKTAFDLGSVGDSDTLELTATLRFNTKTRTLQRVFPLINDGKLVRTYIKTDLGFIPYGDACEKSEEHMMLAFSAKK